MPARELKPEDLKRSSSPSDFPFKTTEEFIFEHEPVHQERGIDSIDFGLNVKSEGYNIFISGAAGTGRNTQLKKAVFEIAAKEDTPGDWLYVNNFIHENEPVAITMPPGMGKVFQKDMKDMIEELKVEIPKAFESEDYEKRKHDILKDYNQKRDTTLQEVEKNAFDEGFTLKQTSTGVMLVPRSGDKMMSEDDYNKLTDKKKEKIEEKKSSLHIKIEQVLGELRSSEKDVKDSVKNLEKEVGLFAVRHIMHELRKKYRQFEDVIHHLNGLQEDILENIDIFKEEEEGKQGLFLAPKPDNKENIFKKYDVNLLVDHSYSEGAPVIIESNPTYYNLIGRIEYVSHFGSMATDYSMIDPGALHKANGGYLILQAMDVMSTFMAWDAIKRVIRDGEIKIEDINEQFRIISTISLKPKPIPCNVKIIMIGSPFLYQILYKYDEDFRKMFKVKADFTVEMARDEDKMKKYAAFIKVRCDEEKLRHFERDAVAGVIEYGSRLAEDKDKLSAHFMYIANIVREASYWAGKDHSKYVMARHVEKAIQEKEYRSQLLEEKIVEAMKNNELMIDVSGEKVGEINGLSVYDMGEYMFGKPSRITVTTYMGKAGVIDIERQVKMGGDIHSKGVMILTGHLGEKFAQGFPLSLSANICFEQSYGGVDGDSASSTEAYCILSSLSGVPLRQDIAVTGSMNQHGVIQPVGGINQKIEGFYHLCKVKGLTGKQGVMIPSLNVRHLMLKDEVIMAVKDKKFHVWAVSTIDEGLEILSGKKAGERDKKGDFPKGTVNYLVSIKLRAFFESSMNSGTGKNKKKSKARGKVERRGR